MKHQNANPFLVLGLPESADSEQIRKAYYSLVQNFPPESRPEEFQALAAAFLSADGKQLVVHAANVQDQPCEMLLQLAGPFSKLPVRRLRTSATEDMAGLPAAAFENGQLAETLPARAMATYLIGP